MDHLCTNRYLKTKIYSELETFETLKRVASANAILKHYRNFSLITVKRHAMVLSFLKANLVHIITKISQRQVRQYHPTEGEGDDNCFKANHIGLGDSVDASVKAIGQGVLEKIF